MSAKKTALRINGTKYEKTFLRPVLTSLRLTVSRRGDTHHVFDADEKVRHTESRDEAAHERIDGQHQQRRRGVQNRIHAPDARPWHHDEKEPCFETVEGKEEGNGHSGRIVAEGQIHEEPSIAE